MYFAVQVPTFWRNLLLPSSVQKKWPQNVLFYETSLHITAVRTSNITKIKAELRVDTLFCVVYCMAMSTDVLQHWMVWKWLRRSSDDLLTILTILYQKDWTEQWTFPVCIASELDDIGTKHLLNKRVQYYQNTNTSRLILH
jgi:hypothetical protein